MSEKPFFEEIKKLLDNHDTIEALNKLKVYTEGKKSFNMINQNLKEKIF